MEILFENPFILVILIGILSSLFKNKKQSAENDRRSTQPSSTKPKRSSSPFDEMKEVFKEVSRSLTEEQKKPVKNLETVYQEKNQTFNQVAEPAIDYKKTETPQKLITKAVNEEKQDANIRVDEKTIVDAVIWAEILGPPRARNPYKSRKVGSSSTR